MIDPFNLFSKELLEKQWTLGEFSGKGDPFTIPERMIAMDHPKCNRLVNGMLMKYSLMLHYLAPGADVLDACCGSGFGAKYLQENGFKVKAIDSNNPEANFSNVRGIDVLKHNLFHGPVGQFDGICLVDAIEHFLQVDQLKSLKILVDQLKPNGVLLVDTPLVAASHRQSSKHKWVLSWEDLESLIREAGSFKSIDRFMINTFKEKVPVLHKVYDKPKFYGDADQIIIARL